MDETEGAVACTRDLANNVVKGKRTKRQRVLSPVPFPSPAPSISTEENEEDEEEDDQDMYNPSSSEFDEEEEDMANCLILLAQGHWPGAEEDQRPYASKRYTSKRFVEGDGYVYQCKTCDRTFPSFQALGGHRASHKKPKGVGVIEEKKIARQLSFLSEDVEEDELKARTSSTNLMGRLQFLGGSCSKSSPKVHECGICGAEFSSGQALGGHMRRHRVTVGTPSVPTATSLTLVGEFDPESGREIQHKMTKSKSLLSLDLDLNLPAPTDGEKQQQRETNTNHPNLVMSAGTLVDCHY